MTPGRSGEGRAGEETLLPEQKDKGHGEVAEVIMAVNIRARVQCYVTKQLKCQYVNTVEHPHLNLTDNWWQTHKPINMQDTCKS